MNIEIIPAMDLIDGACVRLAQGDYDRRTTYGGDPLDTALRFEAAGLLRLHMVDLDGARAQRPANLKVLERIAARTRLEIQYGGGIKSRTALCDVFSAGARRAVCGIVLRRPSSGISRRGDHRQRRYRNARRPHGSRPRGAAQRHRRQGALRRTYHPRRSRTMLAKRIIPCLDIRDGLTVKGVNFTDLRSVGDPVELGARYAAEGADELVYLDISATAEGRRTFTGLVSRIAARIDIPFTVGGGIASVDDAGRLLDAGADKITVNSAAVADPSLIDAVAAKYGSQFVTVAIDARRIDGRWRVTTHGGRRLTDRELFAWAEEACRRGAGEILFTSMDHDGTRNGYPCDTFAQLSLLPVPVIASGGAGSVQHIADVLTLGRADAALAASIFHYGEIPIPVLKRELRARNIPVRL